MYESKCRCTGAPSFIAQNLNFHIHKSFDGRLWVTSNNKLSKSITSINLFLLISLISSAITQTYATCLAEETSKNMSVIYCDEANFTFEKFCLSAGNGVIGMCCKLHLQKPNEDKSKFYINSSNRILIDKRKGIINDEKSAERVSVCSTKLKRLFFSPKIQYSKKLNKVLRIQKCNLRTVKCKLDVTKTKMTDFDVSSDSELPSDQTRFPSQKELSNKHNLFGSKTLLNILKKLSFTFITDRHRRSKRDQEFRNLNPTVKSRTSINLLERKNVYKTESKLGPKSSKMKKILPTNSDSDEDSFKILNAKSREAKLEIPLRNESLSTERKRSKRSTNEDPQIDFHKRIRKKRKIDTQEVEVIKGSMAALPCDLSMKQSKDSVQLVLWIKEGMDTPLYSYDYRELQGGRPKETKPNSKSTLAKRTSFRTDGNPAALIIERAEREDAGLYRCRVDFLLTPTRNSRVNLSVIVPPSRAKVSWMHSTSNLILSNASPLTDSSVIGPFREEEIPTLICSNGDGSPLPNIKWYDGDQLVDESDSVDTEKGIVTNTLELLPLTRSDLGKRYTCQASNINKTQPATSTITIGMILKILSVKVEITGVLQANIQSDVQCLVRGSIPVPSVTWWLGSKKLQVEKPQIQEEGNLTISSLHFTPRPEDDGALLICQAINTKIVDDVIQDTKLISVTYIPKVSVRLGRSLNPSRIKEGDDVYFECSVIGKPSVFSIQWKHNNIPLEAGSGIFVSNMSLVVQGVSRDNGGDYTCHATNAVGIGVSPPLHLDVKYAPVCATKQKVQHSVAKLENAEILCKVHANPANVTFRWTFNNTAEAIDVPDGRFVISGTESRVNYTPMNELDYGTLLCWANNSIGVQDHPCVFQIVAAGKPDPPHNCRVFDVTISSLQVTCLAGDDGGLTQKFMMQVFKIGSASPEKDMTKIEPSFSVANLRPATAYKILVVSLNEKGASRPTELKAYTIRLPESQEETSAEPTRDRERDKTIIPFGVIIGSSVAAVPIILIAVFFIWCRTCRKSRFSRRRQRNFVTIDDEEEVRSYSRRRQEGPTSESVQSVSGKDSSLARSSIELPPSTDSSNADECNPDIISHTSDPLDNQKLTGNISTISCDPTGYFLGNGDATFISLKRGGPLPAHCIEYLHSMGNNRSQNQECLQSRGLVQLSSDLTLNPSSIQIQYSASNDSSRVTNPTIKSQNSSHLLEQGLPLPHFCNHNFLANDKVCAENKKNRVEIVQDSCFAQSLPHLYKPPCGPSVAYKHSQIKDKPATCMRAFQDETRIKDKLKCSNISNSPNNLLSQGYQYRDLSHSETLSDHKPISTQSALHYGTIRRAINGDNIQTPNTAKQRTIYGETNRGSMPDVRDAVMKKNVYNSSHRKLKTESDV